MEIESIIISAGITILSLGLLTVSLLSYRKYRNLRLLFVSLVFVVFLCKGIILSIVILYPDFSALNELLHSTYYGVIDFAILALLFAATLKR